MKIKRYEICPEVLLFTENVTVRVAKSGIPASAKVRSIGVDNNGIDQVFFIIVEDESFDDVPEGDPVPIVPAVQFETLNLTLPPGKK